MNKFTQSIKSRIKEKQLKYKIFFLKSKVVSKRLAVYKTDAIDILENSVGTDLKKTSFLSIKTIILSLLVLGFLSVGQVFAQTTSTPITSAQNTLNQCAPQGGSGLSVWESCGFTPAIFQSGAIAILGNYTQYNSSGSSADNFQYTGGSGALGDVSSVMADLYSNPPVSGVSYFAYLYQKASSSNSTFAATSSNNYSGPVYGFSFLSPIYPIWAVTRNLAFLLLILVILFTGVMIIIGGKVGGQVPITFLSALPNIIAAVILITFSYAIGGFMIDLMNILLGFIYFSFTALNGNLSSGSFHTAFSSQNYIFNIYGGINSQLTTIVSGAAGSISNVNTTGVGVIADLVKELASIVQSTGLSSIIAFIIGVILLFTVFKIIVQLLKGYLIFLFLPVVSPFMFLAGSIPGQSKFIGNFFKGMFKGVLIFVTTYTMFNLIYFLEHSTGFAPGGNSLPLLGIGQIFSNQSGKTVELLISVALFVLIPKIIADVTKALGYDFSSYATELKRGFQSPYGSLRKWTGSTRKSLGSGA
jgi:hypothetical protein